MSQNKIASDNFAAYERENDYGHSAYIQKAKRQKQFYVGEQWEEIDLDRLEAVGRPCHHSEHDSINNKHRHW